MTTCSRDVSEGGDRSKALSTKDKGFSLMDVFHPPTSFKLIVNVHTTAGTKNQQQQLRNVSTRVIDWLSVEIWNSAQLFFIFRYPSTSTNKNVRNFFCRRKVHVAGLSWILFATVSLIYGNGYSNNYRNQVQCSFYVPLSAFGSEEDWVMSTSQCHAHFEVTWMDFLRIRRNWSDDQRNLIAKCNNFPNATGIAIILQMRLCNLICH